MVVVEGGGAIVVEGEEGDDLEAAGDDVGHALEHFFGIAAFVEIADEDEDGFLGLADEGLSCKRVEDNLGLSRRQVFAMIRALNEPSCALVGGVVVLVCRVFGECRRTVK